MGELGEDERGGVWVVHCRGAGVVEEVERDRVEGGRRDVTMRWLKCVGWESKSRKVDIGGGEPDEMDCVSGNGGG